MKIFSLLLVLLTINCYSQIPNPSFENWTNYGSYEDPNNWVSYNGTTTGPGIFTCLKDSPGFVGSFYVHLLTQTFTPSGVLNGFVVSGTPVVPGNGNTFKGYPFTNRPATIDGQWQYMSPLVGSNCSIIVYFTKWNTSINKRDTICYQKTVLSGTVSSWAPFSINLSSGYKSLANPDSCLITMRSNYTSTTSVGDYLKIDDLSFNGIVTGLAEAENSFINFSMYPNPANETVNFSFPDLIEEKEIVFYDLLGKEILRTNEDAVDVSAFNKGIYIIKLVVDGKISNKRMIKN